MSGTGLPADTGRSGPRRGQLVAALVVAVVLLATSVLATVAWAQAGSEASAPAVVGEPDRREARGWPDRSDLMYERMDEMHDWMHGSGRGGGRMPFWFDE